MKLADIQKAAKLQEHLEVAEKTLESFTGHNRPSCSTGIVARVYVLAEFANKSDQTLGSFSLFEDEVRAVAEGRISNLKVALLALGVEVDHTSGNEMIAIGNDLESEA